MKLLLLMLASSALAGCAITPRWAELSLTTAGRDCSQGCLHLTGRRIQFRYSF